MHIAIDARSIFTGGGGDRTYFRNVIEHMARLSPGDRWTLYADRADPDRNSLIAPNVSLVEPLPARIGALWNVTHLVPQIRRDRVDVLHSQYMLPPLGPTPCPMVVTIHDATFRLFPSWFPRHANQVQNLLIPRAARRAARVITGSRSAADDIHATMAVPREKIVVTPYGLDERFTIAAEDAQAAIRAKYGLPKTYVLGVGLLRSRKNVIVVLQAIRALLASDRWPAECVLALTGDWKGSPEAAAFMADTPALNEYVRVLGYVPDADLPVLYSGAALSVYPSLYEGFGFPALESMACGCPVISTDTSSLPEVVGDAGVSLPPDDVGRWTETLRRLLTHPEERHALRQKGLERAAAFTWEQTARQTLAVYREVVTGKP
jgi:glycosyltransferase involved in cell wall biosynthesis